jgi:hypothetical protein
MNTVTTKTTKVMLDLRKIVEMQIHLHFLMQGRILSPRLCTCLAIIAEKGEMQLTDVCNEAYDEEIYENPMSARCALNKAVKEGILVKGSAGHRKTLALSGEVEVVSKGNIMLTYNFGRRE